MEAIYRHPVGWSWRFFACFSLPRQVENVFRPQIHERSELLVEKAEILVSRFKSGGDDPPVFALIPEHLHHGVVDSQESLIPFWTEPVCSAETE